MSEPHITRLLNDWRKGEPKALDELMPLVYIELKKIAGRVFQGESCHHTLQPTALVNEAMIRLSDNKVSWQDRCHFMAIMTTTMRRVLVDHARKRQSEKRGGDLLRVTLSPDIAIEPTALNLIDVDDAISALAGLDHRKAEIIQLHYFGGMKYDEIGVALDLSVATVDRELRFSKAWLKEHMNQSAKQ